MVIGTEQNNLPQLTCMRCGHEWTPRVANPAVCPNCHSPWWFKERRNNGDNNNNS